MKLSLKYFPLGIDPSLKFVSLIDTTTYTSLGMYNLSVSSPLVIIATLGLQGSRLWMDCEMANRMTTELSMRSNLYPFLVFFVKCLS